MSENAQVKKLIQAYESLEDALDGFDWGTPQRCVLGSFTLVGNVSIELPEKSLGPSPVIAEVCAITVPGTGHRGFVALAPMDFDDGEGTWAWVRME
mgnify:CR=1 FL=1